MCKQKTLQDEIEEVVRKSIEQGILFSDFTKMTREARNKIKEEMLEERILRSQKEKTFREKAIKAFKSLENIHYPTDTRKIKYIPMPMFVTKQRKNNCLEILCVYYVKGVENVEEVYLELEERLQIQRSTIKGAETILYRSLAKYYAYEEEEFLKDKILCQEKLRDFLDMIQKS